MSTLPYLPGSQAELPAERILVFAGGDNGVRAFDESLKTVDGISFEGRWMSHSLNIEDPFHRYTLNQLSFVYSAEDDSSFQVRFSIDGGRNWIFEVQYQVVQTGPNETAWSNGFPHITGNDLRFEIIFDKDELINIFGFRPTLVKRGSVEYA
jgi:hypothetical protein